MSLIETHKCHQAKKTIKSHRTMTNPIKFITHQAIYCLLNDKSLPYFDVHELPTLRILTD